MLDGYLDLRADRVELFVPSLSVAQAYAAVTKKTEIAARSLRSMWKFPIFWLYCFTAQMFVNWPWSF